MKSKQSKTGKRSSRRLHGVVSRLIQKYEAAVKKTSEASRQMLDAQMAFEYARREREMAWEAYRDAKQ
jgi:hypothetical protein